MTHAPRTVAALAAIVAAAAAHAQSSWTTNAPGDWLNPANWSDAVPNAAGAEAVILGAPQGGPVNASGTFTAATPVTLGSLTVDMGFSGPSVFFSMPQLIFDNGAGADVFISTDGSLACEILSDVVLMGDLISNWRAGNGRITGSISGDYGITHNPDFESFFELRGLNTYTGETRVLNGRLRITRPEALGSPASGTFITGPTSSLIYDASGPASLELITLENGGRIWLRSAAITSEIHLDGAGGITPWFDDSTAAISGVISGDTLVKSSAQSRIGNDPTAEAALFLSGESNTYAGGTIIAAGLLVAATDASLGAPGTTITFEEPVGFSEGAPALGTRFTTIIDRPITLSDNGWIRAYEETTAVYPQPITGVGSSALTINAPGGPDADAFPDWTGTVALAADNDYSGGTTVRLGTLLADNIGVGSATGSGPVVIQAAATLGGRGNVQGAVDASAGGDIRPGSPVGSITLAGGLTLGPDSTTTIDIAGPSDGQFDQIIAGAPTTIDGDLVVALDPAFTPASGASFELLSSTAGYTGAFAGETLPPGFTVRYEPGSVFLDFTGSPCPPDLDADGAVGASDLAILIGTWNQTGVPADLDGAGVGPSDLAALIGAWGPCG